MTQQQKDFLIELGKTDLETRKAFPELFGLETGKWYESEEGDIMFFSGEYDEDGDPIGYGFLSSGVFCEKNSIGWHREWHEASPETVKDALIAEAKKRYKVGDIIDQSNIYSFVHDKETIVAIKEFRFGNINQDSVEVLTGQSAETVFKNGKWASVITPAPSIEDDIKALREKYPDYCLTIIVEKK